MSDNIPFEIQAQIIKNLPVKSVIRFRSVSKAWKSLIDTHDFISHHGCPKTQLQHLLVTYDDPLSRSLSQKYVSIAEDESFPKTQLSLTPHLLVQKLKYSTILGIDHGLFCLYGDYEKVPAGDDSESGNETAVVWNPSIRKAVAVAVPNVETGRTFCTVLGFGVCRKTSDPKIVKIIYIDEWEDMESVSCIPRQVEVFSLSTGVWKSLNSNRNSDSDSDSNLPRKTIHFDACGTSVVIDGVVYWLATERYPVDGSFNYYNLIISFDMTTEEFGELYLTDRLSQVDDYQLSISKLRKHLVVLECHRDDKGYTVWMLQDLVPDWFLPYSFVRIFSIKSGDASVRGFRRTGEPIIEYVDDGHRPLVVYDPCTKDVIFLENDVSAHSFDVYPYAETLLLLDQPDFVIYDNGKPTLHSEEEIREGF